MKKKNISLLFIIFAFISGGIMAQKDKKFGFDTVAGDPLKARIYKLDNGLHVYLTVYKDAPRIQTYIAVHTGSKMDPPETTGLAHYFEHMMFKGTQHFGTTDWTKEKPLIDQIEILFESYRKEKDEKKRSEIYKMIDSLSYEASTIAIPNEYDKLMDAIGSQGSNAGTSNDYTIYMENIPSNQVENWSLIESDRFNDPVLRIFHTELETVYEEKNMSLTNDSRKVNEALMKGLFPNHPYGTQTTLGEAEHLKNPSMKNIREFFARYYVPNNMAICMSGDFNPDDVIRIVDKYFGKLKPSPVEPLKYGAFQALKEPMVKEITGLEAENIRIGFGFDIKANDDNAMMVSLIGTILANGKAGLIDLNLNQAQKVLNASAYANQLADYAMLTLSGRPRTGQQLDEVKDLLLQQVDILKKGDFPDWFLEAAINNLKLSQMKQYESNQGRAMAMANTFLNDIPYVKYVNYIKQLTGITRKDILDFANKYLQNNYVIVYKRQGMPEDIVRIKKPPITPIYMNRDQESVFLQKIRENQVTELQPVFLDYSKDLQKLMLPSNSRLLHKTNSENGTFNLVYFYKMGKNHDKVMNFAMNYLPFLGTSNYTAEQIRQELYRLACTFNVNSGDEETSLTLNGLSENFEKALALMEDLLTDPKPDSSALKNLVSNTLKSRKDAKSNQNDVFSALVSYGIFGTHSPYKNILSESELKDLTAEQLCSKIKELKSIEHQVLYYGPQRPQTILRLTARYDTIRSKMKKVPEPVVFTELETNRDQVLFAHYDAKQAKLQSVMKAGKFDRSLSPEVALFNMYFGSNIVFQELREKRALAYTATSRFQEPADLQKSYLNVGYIATQNDKILDAFAAFNSLFNDIPLSEITFKLSENAILNRIRSERITKMNVIWNFLNAEKLGLNYDIRKDIFEKVSKMSIGDIKSFDEKFLMNKTKTYLVLGKEADMDFNGLEKFGPVQKLTLEDIFGY